MLNLFMARECMNKEKFIYENIKGKTYVLVPNQYTLVAEEQALSTQVVPVFLILKFFH